MLGLCGTYVGSMLVHVGFLGPGVLNTPANFWVMLGHVGPMWDLCWVYVGPCWAMVVPNLFLQSYIFSKKNDKD